MFEAAELGRQISKKEFAAEEPGLRTQLLEAQLALRDAGIATVILVAGVEGAGRGYVVNRLNKWLDSRGIQTYAFWDETDEERERPPYWRYWRALPARGGIGVLFGAWYGPALHEHAHGEIDDDAFDRQLNRIADFEHMLTLDGMLLIKFWFHLSRDAQAQRFKSFTKKGPTRRKLTVQEKHYAKHYDAHIRSAERAIRMTDSGDSPWYLIESADHEYRDLTMGRTLLAAMRRRLEQNGGVIEAGLHDAQPPAVPEAKVTILDHLDMTPSLSTSQYHRALETHQHALNRLSWAAWEKKRSAVVVLEGWDAAGKGGAIRRMTDLMDARLYRVISVGAPSDEELAHHYLWRFWRHIPRAGYMTLYDRSWYGRVLVERIERLATDPEWMRAYHEINDFEEQLRERGIALSKFWIHIDQDEQLKRFEDRERTPWKRYKITKDDWRNRAQWEAYKTAVNDMVAHTSTAHAPWVLIAGNDKRHARIAMLQQLVATLESMLD